MICFVFSFNFSLTRKVDICAALLATRFAFLFFFLFYFSKIYIFALLSSTHTEQTLFGETKIGTDNPEFRQFRRYFAVADSTWGRARNEICCFQATFHSAISHGLLFFSRFVSPLNISSLFIRALHTETERITSFIKHGH